MELHYFMLYAAPWTAKVDDEILPAGRVSPISKKECRHVHEATRAQPTLSMSVCSKTDLQIHSSCRIVLKSLL